MYMAKSKQQYTPKKKHTVGVVTVSLVAVLLCTVLLFSSYTLQNKIDEYDAVAKNLQEQIEEQLLESQELERESEYIKTEAYMEQIARDRLGLVKKNEIIFKIEDN